MKHTGPVPDTVLSAGSCRIHVQLHTVKVKVNWRSHAGIQSAV